MIITMSLMISTKDLIKVSLSFFIKTSSPLQNFKKINIKDDVLNASICNLSHIKYVVKLPKNGENSIINVV